jgi:hypothetical protein
MKSCERPLCLDAPALRVVSALMRAGVSGLLALALAACDLNLATPTPAPPLFSDNFSQDRGFWDLFVESGATSQLVGGQLAVSVTKPGAVALSVSAINVSDFDVTVTATFAAGDPTNSYGVVFRYLDNENFYRFDLTGDGLWGVSRRTGDQWISIIDLQKTPALHPGRGQTNVLRIVARGADFTFFANGLPVGSVHDNNLPIGRIGLFVSSFDQPAIQVDFDDVRLTKPQ